MSSTRFPKPRDPAAPAPETPDYRTVAGLSQHPLFKQLSDKQRTFLLTYIETGSRDEALRRAYNWSDPGSDAAKAWANKLLRDYAIRNLLSAYHGYKEENRPMRKPELLALLAERLRCPDLRHTEFISLAKLLIELQTWARHETVTPKTPAIADSNDTLNALVQQLEQNMTRKE